MGSQGSVLPLFLEQIARGGPVTVTHPDAQRYFITLDEAVRTSARHAECGLHKALLLPHIGPAVRILDLARYLLAVHHSPASIEFTGLRPGDKLSEQLVSSGELPGSEGELGGSGLRAIDTPIPADGGVDASRWIRSAPLPVNRTCKSFCVGLKPLCPSTSPAASS